VRHEERCDNPLRSALWKAPATIVGSLTLAAFADCEPTPSENPLAPGAAARRRLPGAAARHPPTESEYGTLCVAGVTLRPAKTPVL
jgi:hypothetical protein